VCHTAVTLGECPHASPLAHVHSPSTLHVSTRCPIACARFLSRPRPPAQPQRAEAKRERAAVGAQDAIRAAEQKGGAQLASARERADRTLRHVRAKLWFERFAWFISSENYLVLAGKSAA